MRDILTGLRAWTRAGVPFALATVVGTWRSAPRQPGAAMAVAADGQVVGSVSGGCVEGAVHAAALQVLTTGRAQLLRFGVSDDDAFQVGLTCGGTIEIFVQSVDHQHGKYFPDLLDAVAAGTPVAWAFGISGPTAVGEQVLVWPDATVGTLGSTGLDVGALGVARGMLAQGRNGLVHLGRDGQQRQDIVTIFVQAFAPRPRMLVFGAIDFAVAVARIGRFLDFHVTVCDARPTFATFARFPEVDELVVSWPHRYLADTDVDEHAVICVLTHDPKFDLPLLELALNTRARYIGVMGSRRSHAERERALRQRGVTDAQLARLSSPIGLDLGGRTPEETAIAIAAEIVATGHGGTGRRLTQSTEPIHRPI